MNPQSESGPDSQVNAPNSQVVKVHRYWRANLVIVGVLLGIWAVVGYGCGIFWIEPLNEIRLGQVGLGFWVAQQGAIFVFVLLVAVYAWLMDRLDRNLGN